MTHRGLSFIQAKKEESKCRESSRRTLSEAWIHGLPVEMNAQQCSKLCSGYRIFRHPTENKVVLVCEHVDLDTFEVTSGDPDTERAKTRHIVLEPVGVYFEVESGRRVSPVRRAPSAPIPARLTLRSTGCAGTRSLSRERVVGARRLP